MADRELTSNIALAAQWIAHADGTLITAGAGIGVDSGLPDFRGDAGFWHAYPALARGKIRFADIANHQAFIDHPALAWGFYGHRLQLYRSTVPHDGFHLLQHWAASVALGGFVYTSNVDGQFQKAGFAQDRIVECHGSIHHVQCIAACTGAVWSGDTLAVDVDSDACQLRSSLPRCPHCGRLARPNILLFNDWAWLSERTDLQLKALDVWLARVKHPVVVEIGAGTAIPSVRRKGEGLRCPLIRINPDAAAVTHPHRVGLPITALNGLQLLQAALERQQGFPAR